MKPLSISIASVAILAAASFGVQAQGQPPLQENAPGVNKTAPEKSGKSDNSAQPSGEKSGGKEVQAPAGAGGDKAERPGRADAGDKPDPKKAADKADDKPDPKKAAEKADDGMNKDAKGAEKADGKAATDQGKSGDKPEKQATREIKPEQKTVIKQTFVTQNIRPQRLNVQVRVGVAVPRTVVLYALPPTLIEIYPSYRSYKFVLLDNDTVLVIDPVTWEIVDVIEV